MEKAKKYNLSSIYFYLSKGCNLRCRHCWIVPDSKEYDKSNTFLDINLFRSIIEQAKPLGLSSVKLTGGEPLLHPNIKEILDFIRKEELVLWVETNGVLCSPEIAQMMKACKQPSVSVSLDGSDRDTNEWVRGVPGCFDKTMEGIKNLVNVGFKPEIIMTVMRRNRDQMEKIVKLAESMGAGAVKFNILQPTGKGENMHRSGETLKIEELVELGKWVEDTLVHTTAIRVFYHHPPAFRPLSAIFGKQNNACGICGIHSIIGVLASGEYALCGIGEVIPELVFGNGARDKLEDVWNNAPVLKELREGLADRLKGICSRCIMRHLCFGNCVAQNYYRSRDLWSSFWYCEEANKLGLFPKSRSIHS